MKKTLPSVRIHEDDYSNIRSAIKKFNSNSIVSLDIQGFRRLSYKLLATMILNNQEIPLNLN